MDFIKNSPMEIIEKDSFWISIELQFKLVCNLPYSLTLHLKVCSGQVWVGNFDQLLKYNSIYIQFLHLYFKFYIFRSLRTLWIA